MPSAISRVRFSNHVYRANRIATGYLQQVSPAGTGMITICTCSLPAANTSGGQQTTSQPVVQQQDATNAIPAGATVVLPTQVHIAAPETVSCKQERDAADSPVASHTLTANGTVLKEEDGAHAQQPSCTTGQASRRFVPLLPRTVICLAVTLRRA